MAPPSETEPTSSGVANPATGLSESPGPTAPESSPASKGFLGRLGAAVTNASLLFIWIGLIILFGILKPDTFLTLDTARTIMGEQAITAIMALALVVPVAARQFDLAIGATMGMAVIIAGVLMVNSGVPPALAIILTLLAGVGIGLVNGFIVVNLKVNSFIATLGTSSILIALQQWVSGGEIITAVPKGFLELGRTTIFTIPIPFFYMLAIGGVLWYVLEYRQTGRYLYASGSNPDAARLAGVRVGRLTVIALAISAAVAALAGIIFLMRIGSTSLNSGAPYLLPAFAAVFLGATQFKEGNVNIPGTLVAVYVLATGVKGVQLLGSPFWVDELINGTVLIVAVALAIRSGRQTSGL
jgi:ribose transport system permease protein